MTTKEPVYDDLAAPVDPLSQVPTEVPDDVILDVMVPKLETADDVFRFQMCQRMMTQLEKQRIAQNKRLIALSKAWDERREAMREDLIRIVAAAGGKLSTMIATTSIRKDLTELGVEVHDELVAALFLDGFVHRNEADDKPAPASAPESLHSTTGEVLLEWRPHITGAGKQYLAGLAQMFINDVPEDQEIDYDTLVPGCSVKLPRTIISTYPKRSVELSREMIATWDLDRMLPNYIDAARQSVEEDNADGA